MPSNLKGLVFPFNYNKIEELEYIVNKHEIGVIKMEVERSSKPKDDFLNKVRKLATKKNIILIFDECTTGFRETFGGLHKKICRTRYRLVKDSNGYAITAVTVDVKLWKLHNQLL